MGTFKLIKDRSTAVVFLVHKPTWRGVSPCTQWSKELVEPLQNGQLKIRGDGRRASATPVQGGAELLLIVSRGISKAVHHEYVVDISLQARRT